MSLIARVDGPSHDVVSNNSLPRLSGVGKLLCVHDALRKHSPGPVILSDKGHVLGNNGACTGCTHT